MKRTIAVASACTTLFSAASIVNAEEMVTTENLNIRQKPTTTASRLGTLPKNTKINVSSISNGWGQFQYKGQTAYVTAQYLKTTNAGQGSSTTTKSYIVNTTVLNVREQASATSKQIGKVYEGNELNVIKTESNGWYKIKLGSKTGYVSGDYVKVKNSTVGSNPAPTPPPSQEVDKTKEYIVNTSTLNVRDKAGTSGKQIGQVYNGNKLDVVKKESNGWYQIRYNGKTGYVSGDYVTVKNISTPTPTPPPSQEVDKTKEYIVNTSTLNVRDKASTSGKQIGQVYNGNKLDVVKKESNGWYQIRYNGKTGYVSGDYVTVKNTSTPTPTPPPSQEVDKTKEYIVNTSTLNVRDKASTSGKQIGQVYNGNKLDVTKKESNGWYQIRYNGKTGYVSGDYVTVKNASTSTPPPVTDASKTYVVSVNSLNVRTGPSETYSVIGSYKMNERIQSSRLVDGWLEVNYNGKKGYVSSQYVKEEKDVVTEGVLKGRVIVLDPGHGGHDPGAINENGVLEKNIVLNVARFAEPLLEKLGASVILTRTGDSYLTLSERTKIAENIKADAFLSIHANSAASSGANGLETYYYTSSRAMMSPSERDEKSKILAQMVQEELVAELGLNDRGIKKEAYYVIANTKSMPSALTELGFVSNPEESLFIDDRKVQERMAQAITRAFIRFFATY